VVPTDHFFCYEDIYKEKTMNFSVILGTQEQLVISAPSWSACLAYCEGTGKPIQNIQLISAQIINYNVEGTNCYTVSALKNAITENHLVWESNFDTLNTWIESQGFSSVQLVITSNKAYVVV
jgi:hypothetical protein